MINFNETTISYDLFFLECHDREYEVTPVDTNIVCHKKINPQPLRTIKVFLCGPKGGLRKRKVYLCFLSCIRSVEHNISNKIVLRDF